MQTEMQVEMVASAASLLGRRSAQARKERWGEEEFRRRMREWGKLGGRPPKNPDKKIPSQPQKGGRNG